MAFRYSLQNVLRLRSSLERQEEQRLFAAAAMVAKVRAEIEQLENDHFARQRQAHEEIAAGSFGATFEFLATCEAAFKRAQQALRQKLEQAEKERIKQLQRYKEARQKREILEGLRDRQEAAYDLEFSRHEQQRADEAHLLRLFVNSSE